MNFVIALALAAAMVISPAAIKAQKNTIDIVAACSCGGCCGGDTGDDRRPDNDNN